MIVWKVVQRHEDRLFSAMCNAYDAPRWDSLEYGLGITTIPIRKDQGLFVFKTLANAQGFYEFCMSGAPRYELWLAETPEVQKGMRWTPDWFVGHWWSGAFLCGSLTLKEKLS